MFIIEKKHKILVISAVLCCTFTLKGQISSIQDTIFEFLWQKLEFFQENLCETTGTLSFAPENPWVFSSAWVFFALSFCENAQKKPVLSMFKCDPRIGLYNQAFLCVFAKTQGEKIQVLEKTQGFSGAKLNVPVLSNNFPCKNSSFFFLQ